MTDYEEGSWKELQEAFEVWADAKMLCERISGKEVKEPKEALQILNEKEFRQTISAWAQFMKDNNALAIEKNAAKSRLKGAERRLLKATPYCLTNSWIKLSYRGTDFAFSAVRLGGGREVLATSWKPDLPTPLEVLCPPTPGNGDD